MFNFYMIFNFSLTLLIRLFYRSYNKYTVYILYTIYNVYLKLNHMTKLKREILSTFFFYFTLFVTVDGIEKGKWRGKMGLKKKYGSKFYFYKTKKGKNI